MVNNKGPGGGEKESGKGLVHAMQRSGPQAKYHDRNAEHFNQWLWIK
jgi:hypothetical protein